MEILLLYKVIELCINNYDNNNIELAMIYKEKILLVHRNSLLQERIGNYLRESGFSVIMANNVDNTFSLVRSMKPDLILWGETLTAHSKEILRKIKNSRVGTTLPVIALISDIELFDRIEVSKLGINDVLDSAPSLPEIKVKIRFHLAIRERFRYYENEVTRLQNISELHYNLINVQDVNRLCELVNDHVYDAYNPDNLITLVYNTKTNEYDYKSLLSTDPQSNSSRDTIFDFPVWKSYFFSKQQLPADRITDKYILDFFRKIGLLSDVFYQFPLRAGSNSIGLIILGISGRISLHKNEMNELITLSNSLVSRIVSIHSFFTGKVKKREETAEIHNLFQRLNEDEVSKYLSRQLLTALQADVSIYFNYNPGFNFLYPQYCYKTGSDKNIFRNEKPPVLMIKESPNFQKFLSSHQASAHFNLDQSPADDLKKIDRKSVV